MTPNELIYKMLNELADRLHVFYNVKTNSIEIGTMDDIYYKHFQKFNIYGESDELLFLGEL